MLCAPSLAGESFGMVLIEAFAAGTPVIASQIAGYRDVVNDGVDGVLVPPADPQALAEELQRLWLEPERRIAIGRGRAAAAPSATPGRGSPTRSPRVYERAMEPASAAVLEPARRPPAGPGSCGSTAGRAAPPSGSLAGAGAGGPPGAPAPRGPQSRPRRRRDPRRRPDRARRAPDRRRPGRRERDPLGSHLGADRLCPDGRLDVRPRRLLGRDRPRRPARAARSAAATSPRRR